MALNPFSRYPTKVATGTSAYPYGVPRNVTTPGDGTGTPWEEDLIKDIFGLQQELLSKAGITPSGNPDQVGTSQYLDAIRRAGGYPGKIDVFALNDDPDTFGIRALVLDGSGVLRATYSDLDTAVYCGNTANPTADAFYRADNANGTSRNTAGAYLILPDCRGKFIRGYDPTAVTDPSGASRLRGSNQAWAALDHMHELSDTGGDYNLASSHDFSGGGPYTVLTPAGGGTLIADTMYTGTNFITKVAVAAGNLSSVETRPVNISFQICIWY